MNGYIFNFAVYTMAMIGFLCLCVFIYKKSININNPTSSKNFLKVENSLRLSPSKTLFVIKAGREKFLIAADSSNTTLISKLTEDNSYEEEVYSDEDKIADISIIKKIGQRIGRG